MRRLFALAAALLAFAMTYGQGIPFIRNFTAEDYHANNINYDIETDENGNVFVANFEGLLYYDYAEWRLIHAPGISRITVVFRASDNTIWVGGYNYFGKVVRKANGDIELKRIAPPNSFRGEVKEIYERDGELLFFAGNTTIYRVANDKLTVKKVVDKEAGKMGVLDVVDVEALESGEKDVVRDDTVKVETLGNGIKAIVRKNAGITIVNEKNHTQYSINNANGLCSDIVAYTKYDGRGHLWGATSKGIFVIHIPTAITRFSTYEGVQGVVLTIESINGRIYAGTDDGLFRQEGYRFVAVPGVSHTCWQMKKSGDGILAATAEGIFRISPNGTVRQLTTATSMSLLEEGSTIYSGELDGIYLMQANGQGRRKLCHMENVMKIEKDNEGTIWTQSLYGVVWMKRAGDRTFRLYKNKGKAENMQTIVMSARKTYIISAEDTTLIPYPLVSHLGSDGIVWLTDSEGRNLYRWKDGKKLNDMYKLLFPIKEIALRTIYTRGNEIWLGSDNGLTVINTQVYDPTVEGYPKLFIRTVKLGTDSILLGGFGEMPKKLPKLKSNENDLVFTFSLDYPAIAGETMYRYRLNDGSWSEWSPNTSARFSNLTFGSHTFYVQARDVLNRVTDIKSIDFQITPPFYYRWYMNLLYLLLLVALVFFFFRLRLRRLEAEKVRLEKIVRERSAEVVRLEKMATAGKLTQGLIDRILNPLNYIINFAKLSEGLVKDAKANIEDEKENMDEENYEDTMDVLDMLEGNLQKVGEHGQNTTRTLKAMEEMLKDRSGGIVAMDLMEVIRHDKVMLREYYKEEIGKYGINIVFSDTSGSLPINGNADQLSKTIMSLLANAVYAVVKKAQKQPGGEYKPEIGLHITQQGTTIQVGIHDNGVGIEETILEKIFDPFFTTKTTGEAAGVGLYLSREIIQNHGGDIIVKSVKDEYSEFIITLPVRKA